MDKNWHKVLEKIKSEVSFPTYKTWFSKTVSSLEGEVLTIIAPSTIVKDNLQTKQRVVLENAVAEVFGPKLILDFKVNPSLESKNSPEEEIRLEFVPSMQSTHALGLNSKYNLENFVVGLSNQLAFAAAQAVVQNPGLSYNPLFVYGGTGVGKTHLMQAVGNSLSRKNPSIKIIYCSTEHFMNDFVQSIQTKRTGEFRTKYRNVDLLLIDDIQFISGRDAFQEEFFHTFNELHSKNAQIILTSDRPPNEMQKVEARLVSRFQGGLTVDIQTPDFDTRVAILKAKCQERGDTVDEDCLTLIAENMPTNARELEGKFIQIIESAKLRNLPLTIEAVREMLGKPQLQSLKLDHKKVIAQINQYFNIKMADITGPKRKKELVLPRQLAMYLLYEECKLPYERIGDLLGGRDHTTIMHGVEKMRESTTRDREIQRMLIEIKQTLQQ